MDLVRDGAKPLYQQVKEKLEQQIKAGKYKPHEKLPSERVLCEIFKVSHFSSDAPFKTVTRISSIRERKNIPSHCAVH